MKIIQIVSEQEKKNKRLQTERLSEHKGARALYPPHITATRGGPRNSSPHGRLCIKQIWEGHREKMLIVKGGDSTSDGYIIKPSYRETLSIPYLAKASTIVFANLNWFRKTMLITVDKAHISLKIKAVLPSISLSIINPINQSLSTIKKP